MLLNRNSHSYTVKKYTEKIPKIFLKDGNKKITIVEIYTYKVSI